MDNLDYARMMSAALRRPGRAPEPSVMDRPAVPQWRPEYEQEPALEVVSPEDFVPSPKSLIAALKGAPVVMGGMKTLYHGSARKFDKFDPARILSGEGNVSYGHGLYAAEHPSVGRHYAMVAEEANKARQFDLKSRILSNLSALRKVPYRGQAGLLPQDRVAKMLENKKLQAEIDADPLRRYLYAVGVDEGVLDKTFDLDAGRNLSLYREMVKDLGGHKPASEELARMGHTGTRYLDETSRGLGKGTSNFVLFNPSLAEILKVEALK